MRLIDADELFNELNKLDLDYGAMGGVAECLDRIDNAPTIEPSGDLIGREDAIEVVGNLMADDEIEMYAYYIIEKALNELPSADRPKVAYICDGRKCDNDCSECFRTLDIEHARDFKLMGNTYYQQEQADRPKGEWIDREDSKPQLYVPEASTERVVHCKDCIYSSQPDGEELFVCGNVLGMSGWVREDEFCSSGSL